MANAGQPATLAHNTTGRLTIIKKRWRKEWALWLMVTPAIVHLIIFRYIPIYGITIAFQKFSFSTGYFGGEWVGLKYFKMFLEDPYIVRIVRNTIVLSTMSLVFTFPVPIVLSILLNEVRSSAFKRTIQTISYLPHFISTVIVIGLVKIFFEATGPVNRVLMALNLPAQQFLLSGFWFRFLYIFSNVWQSAGWGTIIFLATLSGINPELYEAAYIDGANRFRRMTTVTLPGLKPTIILLVILNIGNLMNVGVERVLLLYNPVTYNVADVISTYVYRRGLQQMQYSYAAAVGMLQNIVNLLLLISANRLARSFSEVSLW